jgi:predicted dehydrogenase
MSISRRGFLASNIAAPFVAAQGQRKYRIALIGSGWWGMNILGCAMESGRCKVAAMCDVDRNQLDPAAEKVVRLSGDQPRKYRDFRELLDKEKPDVAIVATPDHWHPLIAIAAMKAGAHVYVEKPIGHTIMEGRAMVNTARANDRVVQVGTHRRVSPHNVSGMQFLRAGKAGKIGMVRAFVNYAGISSRPVPDSDPPAGLDWDFWCGPAPLRPYNKLIHPKGFRQFLDYSNGQLGDWGIHWMDQILWCMEEKYPRRVFSSAARRVRQDNTDAPDSQLATFDFDSFTVQWEHRMFAGNGAEKHEVGCYFYGTEGVFHMGWLDGWTFYPAKKGQPVIHEEPKLNKPDEQNIRELFADFLESIDVHRRPKCDIEVGHRSTNVSLLGMLSMKLGRSIQWDGEKEQVIGDPEANKLLRRVYREPWVYPASY